MAAYGWDVVCNPAGFLRPRSNMHDQQPLQYRRMSLDNMGTYHQANLPGKHSCSVIASLCHGCLFQDW